MSFYKDSRKSSVEVDKALNTGSGCARRVLPFILALLFLLVCILVIASPSIFGA